MRKGCVNIVQANARSSTAAVTNWGQKAATSARPTDGMRAWTAAARPCSACQAAAKRRQVSSGSCSEGRGQTSSSFSVRLFASRTTGVNQLMVERETKPAVSSGWRWALKPDFDSWGPASEAKSTQTTSTTSAQRKSLPAVPLPAGPRAPPELEAFEAPENGSPTLPTPGKMQLQKLGPWPIDAPSGYAKRLGQRVQRGTTKLQRRWLDLLS
mmetsp:Transcript_147331/g.473393  ORF Transcript_147331/g.473393 Transcript_147331/m.473393 type:complete len:212 (+) Transcript_147331:3569-4204(+)